MDTTTPLTRTAGRPRTAPVAMTVRMDEAMRDALRARATREGVPVAELVRDLIETAMKEH